MIERVWVQLGFDTPRLAVQVAVAGVEEGTLLQLHLRDSMWAQQGLRDLVQVSIESTPQVMLKTAENDKILDGDAATYLCGLSRKTLSRTVVSAADGRVWTACLALLSWPCSFSSSSTCCPPSACNKMALRWWPPRRSLMCSLPGCLLQPVFAAASTVASCGYGHTA